MSSNKNNVQLYRDTSQRIIYAQSGKNIKHMRSDNWMMAWSSYVPTGNACKLVEVVSCDLVNCIKQVSGFSLFCGCNKCYACSVLLVCQSHVQWNFGIKNININILMKLEKANLCRGNYHQIIMRIRQLQYEMDTLVMTKYPVIGKPEEFIQICTVTKMVKNSHKFTVWKISRKLKMFKET
jgi:hypothetical protein